MLGSFVKIKVYVRFDQILAGSYLGDLETRGLVQYRTREEIFIVGDSPGSDKNISISYDRWQVKEDICIVHDDSSTVDEVSLKESYGKGRVPPYHSPVHPILLEVGK